MRFLTEPYEGPFNALEVGAPAEVPMSEFWVGNNMFAGMANLAASIAHHNGRQVVGAESFTATGIESRHRNYPGMLKAQGDYNWSNGVNRFILHTNAHQPWEVGPGFSLGQYGTNFNRHNTWWEQSRAWMDYCARSQYLLQQGQGVQDILVFIGESSPNMGIERPDIRALGLDYDQISASKLMKLTVRDGMLRSTVGRNYRILVLPENDAPTLTLLQKVKELAEGGALIIGQRPTGSPSLDGFPESDVAYKALVEELWDGGLVKDISVDQAVSESQLQADFTGGMEGQRLLYIHRTTSDAEIYFVSNQQKDYRTEKCRFRVEGRVPEIWNAVKGTMERVVAWNSKEGQTEIRLDFEPEESYFVVFRKPMKDDIQYTSIAQTLTEEQREPLPELEIIRAEYGQFQPSGIADITGILRRNIRDGRINVSISNDFAGGDPCFGIVKHAFIRYTLDGVEHTVTAQENHPLELPQQGEHGELAIVGAFYGNIPLHFEGRQAPEPTDVTDKVKERIDNGEFVIDASSVKVPIATLIDGLSEPKLHLIYKVGGEWRNEMFTDEMTINLSRHKEEPRTIIQEGEPYWVTPEPGEVELTTAGGEKLQAHVEDVPPVINIESNWDVHFDQKWGEAWDVCFPKLISFSESEDEEVKHFSGTAIYSTAFTLPEEYVASDIVLELGLGQVYVIAELFVNDQDMGILWNAPFTKDITKAVQAGVNKLEVRVTNQWINRLIGDEQLPADYKASGIHYAEWPDWMKHPEDRKSGRTTFVAHRHWNANDPLQPAGLVGPVVIRPYVKVAIE